MSSNLYLGPDKKVDCMRSFWGQQLERLQKTLQLPFHFIFIILFFRHYLVFPFQSKIEKFFASNLDNFEKFANTTFLDKTTLAKICHVERWKKMVSMEKKYFSFWRSQVAGFCLSFVSFLSLLRPRQHSYLGSHFLCFHNTPLRDLIKDTPLMKESRKR